MTTDGGSMETTVTTSTQAETKTDSGVYVYSIIELSEPRNFGKIGIGGRGDEVYTVHYRDLAAVVSRAPLQVYDPPRGNAPTPAPGKEGGMIETACPPVPYGFG